MCTCEMCQDTAARQKTTNADESMAAGPETHQKRHPQHPGSRTGEVSRVGKLPPVDPRLRPCPSGVGLDFGPPRSTVCRPPCGRLPVVLMSGPARRGLASNMRAGLVMGAKPVSRDDARAAPNQGDGPRRKDKAAAGTKAIAPASRPYKNQSGCRPNCQQARLLRRADRAGGRGSSAQQSRPKPPQHLPSPSYILLRYKRRLDVSADGRLRTVKVS